VNSIIYFLLSSYIGGTTKETLLESHIGPCFICRN